MKNIVTLIAVFIMTANAWAQAPQEMSYQAVVRDAGNTLVTNQVVGTQISILQGSTTGTAVYVETHTPTTNANGLVSLVIGNGAVLSGDFGTINWGNGPFFIQTETDPTGGTNYSITGTTQLLSVAYALRAAVADSVEGQVGVTTAGTNVTITGTGTTAAPYVINATEVDGSITNEIELPTTATAGDMNYWDGSAWVAVTGGTEGAILQFMSGVPTWVEQIPPAVVGDFRDGGVVFWVDPNDNTKGLVVDVNQLAFAQWGCDGTMIAGADGTAIGTGAQNTVDIEAGCTTSGTAADLCASSTAGGFTDWFLPSIGALEEIYSNLSLINATITNNSGEELNFSHWSSSEANASQGYSINFDNNGSLAQNSKNNNYRVRAVRAF